MTQATEARPLTDQLRDAANRGELTLPPLPQVATKILEAFDESSRSTSQGVAELIRHEPAIAASVLRMANSAAFGGLSAITDLQQAIARLGMSQVAALVTAMLHKGHFESEDASRKKLLQDLWDHAVATAMAARCLAATGAADSEEAFLAGLLHDVGKLAVLLGIDQIANGEPSRVITPPVRSELMAALHTELGHKVLVDWRLPESVCLVALRHHEESPEEDESLVVRVQAANAIARKIAAHPEPGEECRLEELPAVERQNLGEVELAALLVDLEDEFEEVHKLL